MVKRFLRLFKDYRDLEKGLERDEAVIASMNRYIEVLEGRDRERLERIRELEAKNRDALAVLSEALGAAADLRERLTGLCPHHGKEGL
jgi:chromosome segregation ATPase